jgi:hypothetical protein
MITCVVEYVIDSAKIDAFERFGRRWIQLVDSHGGTHHGYLLPAEGASDKAPALFSFPSLAADVVDRAVGRQLDSPVSRGMAAEQPQVTRAGQTDSLQSDASFAEAAWPRRRQKNSQAWPR